MIRWPRCPTLSCSGSSLRCRRRGCWTSTSRTGTCWSGYGSTVARRRRAASGKLPTSPRCRLYLQRENSSTPSSRTSSPTSVPTSATTRSWSSSRSHCRPARAGTRPCTSSATVTGRRSTQRRSRRATPTRSSRLRYRRTSCRSVLPRLRNLMSATPRASFRKL